MTCIWLKRKCVLSRPLKKRGLTGMQKFTLMESLTGASKRKTTGFWHFSHFRAVSGKSCFNKVPFWPISIEQKLFSQISGFWTWIYRPQKSVKTQRVHKIRYTSINTISFMERLHFESLTFTFELHESLTEVNWHEYDTWHKFSVPNIIFPIVLIDNYSRP